MPGATSTTQTSILTDLMQTGFAHIPPAFYLNTNTKENAAHLDQVQATYDSLPKDPNPGNRYRAYMRLNWCPEQETYVKAANNDYFQSKKYNYADGGKIRKFEVIDDAFVNNPVIQALIEKDLEIARQSNMFVFDSQMEIGLHQIRYQTTNEEAAYSSPMWLHKDDEPLVFVHLLDLTDNVLGGDNLIAPDVRRISKILRLTSPLESLLLDKKVYHAVTPMGCSDDGIARRDILLVTFQRREPESEDEQESNQ